MTHLHLTTIAATGALLLFSASADAQSGGNIVRGLTRDDLAYVARDTAFGWVTYRSDGTARGDSARRFAAAGAWDLEGGDWQRGLRLVQAAFQLGVADSSFYRDAFELLKLLRCPKETVVLVEEVRRRWPQSRWADSVYSRVATTQERSTSTAPERPCPVHVRQTDTLP